MRFSSVIAGFAGLAAVHAIATIETKGAKLFTSEGDQFFVKGMCFLSFLFPSCTIAHYLT